MDGNKPIYDIIIHLSNMAGKGFMAKLKRNIFVRSLYSIYSRYFGYRKSSFGFIGEDVLIEPPCELSNPRNIYLYDHTHISHATIGATNARFIMKKWSGSATGLNVHTGNHAMIVGKFYRSITDAEKPAGYDKDVVVEEDVWIGSNVTLLAGVTIGRGGGCRSRSGGEQKHAAILHIGRHSGPIHKIQMDDRADSRTRIQVVSRERATEQGISGKHIRKLSNKITI